MDCMKNVNLKTHHIIKLKYSLDNISDNRLKIFDPNFVEKNKKNCSLIIEQKERIISSHIDKIYLLKKKGELNLQLKIIRPFTTMENMFNNCVNLISYSDSGLDTSTVKNFNGVFCNCKKLKSVNDISKWDTSKVEDMGKLFQGCKILLNIPEISRWNTALVKLMDSMFEGCTSLQYLPDISQWEIKNVTDMTNMFHGCSSLTKIPDISNWNPVKLNFMSDMFKGCISLTHEPDISKWDTPQLSYRTDIFRECYSLNFSEQ